MYFSNTKLRGRVNRACNTLRNEQWRTQELCSVGGGEGGDGVQQIQLRTEDREKRDLGAAPQSGVLEAAVIWYKKFHFIQ